MKNIRQINILDYLDNAAQCFKDKTAYIDGSKSLTFSQLDSYSKAIGSALLANGYRNIPVIILMNRSVDVIAAFFGAVRAGCAYVPVDPEMAMARIEGIFEDLKPAVVIAEEGTLKLLDNMGYSGEILIYQELNGTETDEEALKNVRDNAIDTDLLYIVYTSGSTGRPKGVAACHRSVIDYIESLSQVLGFSEDTVFGNQTPLYVDACLKEIYPTLKFGAVTYLIPKSLFMFPVKLIDYLNEHKINTICWVVSALTMISGTGALGSKKPEHLHTIAFGSELFPAAQLKIWREALPGARFFNLYGPTECTGMSCYFELTGEIDYDKLIPIGKPFPNTRVMLIDDEICIAGTSLTLGYYNDAGKTDAAFTQNPYNSAYRELIYRTGDYGSINEKGQLVFLSRRDHQIKHMGHRIELGEIENAASMAGVSRAACIYEDGKIVLFYSGSLTDAEMARHLRERLPRFMCPNAVMPLKSEEFPLTPNGKIDRVALTEIYRREKSH